MRAEIMGENALPLGADNVRVATKSAPAPTKQIQNREAGEGWLLTRIRKLVLLAQGPPTPRSPREARPLLLLNWRASLQQEEGQNDTWVSAASHSRKA